MPTPKFRTSSSKRNMRRSHDHLTPAGMSVCTNCGQVKKPHSVCEACGHYKGKSVLPAKQTASNSEFTTEA
jgi:large subunit ribosomal protein L32